MIGEVVAWQNEFLVISTGKEVYRTVDNLQDDVYNEFSIGLDDTVEFEVNNN